MISVIERLGVGKVVDRRRGEFVLHLEMIIAGKVVVIVVAVLVVTFSELFYCFFHVIGLK